MTGAAPAGPPFPVVRWLALAWLALWVPSYAITWGWLNFVQLCDIAVLVTCLALWRGHALWLSSQAVSSIVIHGVWTLNLVSRLAGGPPLLSGTDYMFDEAFPVAVRMMSLYHVFWPALLLWALRRTGYDRRGLALQSGLAAVVLAASRLTPEVYNINNAFRDPLFDRSWGPAPLHLTMILTAIVLIVYWPTHALLSRTLPPARPSLHRANLERRCG